MQVVWKVSVRTTNKHTSQSAVGDGKYRTVCSHKLMTNNLLYSSVHLLKTAGLWQALNAVKTRGGSMGGKWRWTAFWFGYLTSQHQAQHTSA